MEPPDCPCFTAFVSGPTPFQRWRNPPQRLLSGRGMSTCGVHFPVGGTYGKNLQHALSYVPSSAPCKGRAAGGRLAERGSVCGGRPGQRVEEQGTWASRTRKHSEAGCGRPEDGGVGTAKTVKRPPQQPAQPQYANYWAPLPRKRHILLHPAQPWVPRTRKQHQQEHRPQRPTESSDPTQHAKGRTGDCPGPRKETMTRRNVTQGASAGVFSMDGILCFYKIVGPRVLGLTVVSGQLQSTDDDRRFERF